MLNLISIKMNVDILYAKKVLNCNMLKYPVFAFRVCILKVAFAEFVLEFKE